MNKQSEGLDGIVGGDGARVFVGVVVVSVFLDADREWYDELQKACGGG